MWKWWMKLFDEHAKNRQIKIQQNRCWNIQTPRVAWVDLASWDKIPPWLGTFNLLEPAESRILGQKAPSASTRYQASIIILSSHSAQYSPWWILVPCSHPQNLFSKYIAAFGKNVANVPPVGADQAWSSVSFWASALSQGPQTENWATFLSRSYNYLEVLRARGHCPLWG